MVVELRRQEERHGDRVLLVNNTMMCVIYNFGKAPLRSVIIEESRRTWYCWFYTFEKVRSLRRARLLWFELRDTKHGATWRGCVVILVFTGHAFYAFMLRYKPF
jgi:hypothetical protein